MLECEDDPLLLGGPGARLQPLAVRLHAFFVADPLGLPDGTQDDFGAEGRSEADHAQDFVNRTLLAVLALDACREVGESAPWCPKSGAARSCRQVPQPQGLIVACGKALRLVRATLPDVAIIVTTVTDDGRQITSQYPVIRGTGWQGYYKNVADHLLSDAPLIITPEWAKGTIQCLEGCEIGSRENRLVEIEFDF